MSVGDYKGINYGQVYVDVPAGRFHASMAGKQITMIDTKEVSTAEGLDIGTKLTFFRPPKGSRIVGGELTAEAMAAGGTLSVGTGATKFGRKAISASVPFESVDDTNKTPVAAVVDKFLAATVHTAAAKTALLPVALIDVLGYEFDGETDIIVTTAAAALVTGARVTLRVDLVLA